MILSPKLMRALASYWKHKFETHPEDRVDAEALLATPTEKMLCDKNSSKLFFLSASAVYLKFGCFLRLYFGERNGRKPRSCRMHLSPGIVVSSSIVISSFLYLHSSIPVPIQT